MVGRDGVETETVVDDRSDATLVLAVRDGEREAFGVLVERWFDRCADVAWRILHDRGRAAEVTQESLLTAWQQLDRLRDPEAFGGWLLRSTRNRALDRLARERRVVSTGEERDLEGGGPAGGTAAVPELLGTPDVEVGRQATGDLVWAAAAALGERDASLLDLHLRHGLEPEELAAELGITPNAAHQAMFRLRTRLGDAIGAYLLWRAGQPRCVVLAAESAAAGVDRFDAEVVRLVRAHVEECVTCGEERARVTAPAAMFSAVPLLLLPTAARAEVLAELARAGVPVPSGWSIADGDPTAPVRAEGAGAGPEGVASSHDPVLGSGGSAGSEGAAASGVGAGASPRRLLGARRGRVLLGSLLALVLLGGLSQLVPARLGDGAASLAADDLLPGRDGGVGELTEDGGVAAVPEVPTLLPLPGFDTLVPTLPPLETGRPSDGSGTGGDDASGAGAGDGIATDGGGGPSGASSSAGGEPGVAQPERAPIEDAPAGETSDREQPAPDPPSEPPGREVPPPTIDAFTLEPGSVCVLVPGGPPGWQQTARWRTTDADTVTVSARGQTATVPEEGALELCLEVGDEVTLTATGTAGGRTTAVLVAAGP